MSDTRALERPPVRRYRAARVRRPTGPLGPSLARDFAVIVTVWAVTAYPVLWLAYHVAGPFLLRLTGGTP